MSEPAMAPTSMSMWPASASRARELEKIAATTSNTMKASSSASASFSARRSVSTDAPACACAACACPARPSPIAGHVVGVTQHLLHQAAHVGVVDDVVDPRALPAAADETGQAQLRQVLRDGRRLRPHHLGQLVDR